MRAMFDALRALSYASGFFALFVWIALKLRAYDRIWGFILPAGAMTVGLTLMLVGSVLALTCVATFVVPGRGTPAPFDPPRQFVASGCYRYVRNPMYIGGLVLLLGLALFLRSLSTLAMSLAVFLFCHLFVLFYEEPTLKRTFGASYDAYCGSVRRNCYPELTP